MIKTESGEALGTALANATWVLTAASAFCLGTLNIHAQDSLQSTVRPRSAETIAASTPATRMPVTETASLDQLELRDLGSGVSSSSAADADAPLPEAPAPQPEPAPGAPQAATTTTTSGPHIAPIHSEYVPAGWTAPRLTAHDKVVAGAEDLYSVANIGGIFISASYEYVVNSSPNYSPSDAFGKRIGAAAIRETSESIFSEMVFAPLLHEDARYYQKGDGHGFIPRTIYAITRPLITRTDGGHETINGALLLGYAGAAALTPAYYPSINRNFHDVASTYGGSIGGAALGFLVSEFSDDVLQALHLKHILK